MLLTPLFNLTPLFKPRDFNAANLQAKLEETPEGFVWHHHQDVDSNGSGLMLLVPEDIHSEVRHTGGVAVWQQLFPGQGTY